MLKFIIRENEQDNANIYNKYFFQKTSKIDNQFYNLTVIDKKNRKEIAKVTSNRVDLSEELNDPKYSNCWQIVLIKVNEEYRRKGIATAIYEDVAEHAKKQKSNFLISDKDLTQFSMPFWEKQVINKRAYKINYKLNNFDYTRYVLDLSKPIDLKERKK